VCSPIASARDFRRRLAAPLPSVHGPITRLAAPGDHRAPTSARRRESKPPPSSFDVGRPNPLGVARALMARLALGYSHRQAGARGTGGLSSVLDVEKSTVHRAPGIPHDMRALIREMSTTNPLWGAPRIHGELQKLGISVSQSTVAKYMQRHPRPPSHTWRTFLSNHASQIVATDLFVVPTITFRLLFVLVMLAHDSRRIAHVAVTDHPTAAWTAQQHRNAFPENTAPAYLLHYRDCGVCPCRDHHRGHEHPAGSNGTAITVAERLRGARHCDSTTRRPAPSLRARSGITSIGVTHLQARSPFPRRARLHR
jgi:hypothetical protein